MILGDDQGGDKKCEEVDMASDEKEDQNDRGSICPEQPWDRVPNPQVHNVESSGRIHAHARLQYSYEDPLPAGKSVRW